MATTMKLGSYEWMAQADTGKFASWLRVGSTSDPLNTTAGDLTTVRALVGDDIALPSGTVLQVNKNSFVPSGVQFVSYLTGTAAPNNTGSVTVGQQLTMSAAPTVDSPTSDVYGLSLQAQHTSGDFALRNLYGLQSNAVKNIASGTAALANMVSYRAVNRPIAGAITNMFGVEVVQGATGDAGNVGTLMGVFIRNGVFGSATTQIGLNIEALTGATTNIGIQNASNLRQLGYARFGSLSTPTNTTNGDVTVQRLKVADGAFSSTQFSVTGNGALSGFLRVGSETAPTNTTAGDLTAVRLRMPDGAFQTAGTVFELTPADTAGATDTNVIRVLAAKDSSAGANSDVRGLEFTMQDKSASGTQRTLAGIRVLVWHTGAGTLTNSRAFEAKLQNDAGTTTNLDAFAVATGTLAGTVTQARGLVIPNLGAAAVGSAIGIDIAAQSGATTLNVGIRNADGRYLNSNVAKPVNPPAGQAYLYSRLNADLAGATNFKTFWALDENGFESAMSLRARTIYPMPLTLPTATASTALPANNTSAFVSHAEIAFPIRVNQILYNVSGAGNAANVIRIAVYSENGTQKYIDVTDAVGAATGVRTIDITDTTLAPGNYLFLICHSTFSTTACSVTTYTCDTTATAHIASEPDLGGTLTISGGAAPATIDPTALTTVAPSNKLPVIRLLGTALGS
jgi:hypothetical protein